MRHFVGVNSQADCTDLRGRIISHGMHYVPGPDTCTLCICDSGQPKVCKAVLCAPPQDCRSFRLGNTCCEFICLDDVVKPIESTESNVRLAAGGAAAVVLIFIAVVVYRVRMQKQRRPPHGDDQRSLTSIGYISGSMGYMSGTCETALGEWKPHGNYLPRGEAPPPYEEVEAQCRVPPPRIINDVMYHRTYPATVETTVRAEEAGQCAGHGYGHAPRATLQQVANTQSGYSAPLLAPPHSLEHRDSLLQHHPLAANEVGRVSVVGVARAVRLTGSLGAISSRMLSSAPVAVQIPTLTPASVPVEKRPHNVPGFYTNSVAGAHRTIPRISTAVDTSLLDAPLSGFTRSERALHAEIRRSFHKPSDTVRHYDTGRSMPRNLNLASSEDKRNIHSSRDDAAELPCSPRRQCNVEENQCEAATGSDPAAAAAAAAAAPAPATLPLTVDKPWCVCSYAGAPDGGEDADDFRSECENCKSATSSKWTVEWSDGAQEEEDGTQTLQRHPPPAPPPPATATATLPQRISKQSRTVLGSASNWENWFSSIPDSDSESDE